MRLRRIGVLRTLIVVAVASTELAVIAIGPASWEIAACTLIKHRPRGAFLRIIQASRLNSMPSSNLRQDGKPCRLIRRHAATL
jgi:hypothetical protein